MDDRTLWDHAINLNLALADLPMRERLDVLEATWLWVAAATRNDRLVVPGGFETEQTRQVTRLGRLKKIVNDAMPDPEMERLDPEDDLEGGSYGVYSVHGPGRIRTETHLPACPPPIGNPLPSPVEVTHAEHTPPRTQVSD